MVNKKYLDNLLEVLLNIDEKKELKNFLEGILTPKELEEIPHRLEIVKRIKSGEAQHKIAADLGVGVATVTRGSKEIQKGKFETV